MYLFHVFVLYVFVIGFYVFYEFVCMNLADLFFNEMNLAERLLTKIVFNLNLDKQQQEICKTTISYTHKVYICI